MHSLSPELICLIPAMRPLILPPNKFLSKVLRLPQDWKATNATLIETITSSTRFSQKLDSYTAFLATSKSESELDRAFAVLVDECLDALKCPGRFSRDGKMWIQDEVDVTQSEDGTGELSEDVDAELIGILLKRVPARTSKL